MTKRGKATVVWELSDEGRVVVDVDAPLRPFGALPTPPRGVRRDDEPTEKAFLRPGERKKDGTDPDGEPVFEKLDDLPPPTNATKR